MTDEVEEANGLEDANNEDYNHDAFKSIENKNVDVTEVSARGSVLCKDEPKNGKRKITVVKQLDLLHGGSPTNFGTPSEHDLANNFHAIDKKSNHDQHFGGSAHVIVKVNSSEDKCGNGPSCEPQVYAARGENLEKLQNAFERDRGPVIMLQANTDVSEGITRREATKVETESSGKMHDSNAAVSVIKHADTAEENTAPRSNQRGYAATNIQVSKVEKVGSLTANGTNITNHQASDENLPEPYVGSFSDHQDCIAEGITSGSGKESVTEQSLDADSEITGSLLESDQELVIKYQTSALDEVSTRNLEELGADNVINHPISTPKEEFRTGSSTKHQTSPPESTGSLQEPDAELATTLQGSTPVVASTGSEQGPGAGPPTKHQASPLEVESTGSLHQTSELATTLQGSTPVVARTGSKQEPGVGSLTKHQASPLEVKNTDSLHQTSELATTLQGSTPVVARTGSKQEPGVGSLTKHQASPLEVESTGSQQEPGAELATTLQGSMPVVASSGSEQGPGAVSLTKHQACPLEVESTGSQQEPGAELATTLQGDTPVVACTGSEQEPGVGSLTKHQASPFEVESTGSQQEPSAELATTLQGGMPLVASTGSEQEPGVGSLTKHQGSPLEVESTGSQQEPGAELATTLQGSMPVVASTGSEQEPGVGSLTKHQGSPLEVESTGSQQEPGAELATTLQGSMPVVASSGNEQKPGAGSTHQASTLVVESTGSQQEPDVEHATKLQESTPRAGSWQENDAEPATELEVRTPEVENTGNLVEALWSVTKPKVEGEITVCLDQTSEAEPGIKPEGSCIKNEPYETVPENEKIVSTTEMDCNGIQAENSDLNVCSNDVIKSEKTQQIGVPVVAMDTKNNLDNVGVHAKDASQVVAVSENSRDSHHRSSVDKKRTHVSRDSDKNYRSLPYEKHPEEKSLSRCSEKKPYRSERDDRRSDSSNHRSRDHHSSHDRRSKHHSSGSRSSRHYSSSHSSSRRHSSSYTNIQNTAISSNVTNSSQVSSSGTSPMVSSAITATHTSSSSTQVTSSNSTNVPSTHVSSSSTSTHTNNSNSHRRASVRKHQPDCKKITSGKMCSCLYNMRTQVNITDLATSYIRKLSSERRALACRELAPRRPWSAHHTTQKLKYQQYFHVDTDLNGGSTVCHLYMEELAGLDSEVVKDVADEFIKLSYQEDKHGHAYHVMGIVHNGAKYLPDLVEYMADHYGTLPVKVGSLKGFGTQSTTMAQYRDDVYKTYSNGTFRYAPLQEVSLCGTQGEEVGAFFPDMIERLEFSPFMRPVMPWGPLSAMKFDNPLQSNDGPIFWVRPGEQTIPSSGLSRSQGRLQKGACRLTEERAALFEDRTKPHGDHSGSYENAAIEPVCAVGVLKAVICGHPEHKGRATKDVIAFNASEYHSLLDVLQIDRFEPPLTQCTQWLDISRLNMLRRQGITYAHIELHDGDVYYLPRKVIHQFQTVSAVASVAWHVRYYQHCDPLVRPGVSLNKGAVYREQREVPIYHPPKPLELDDEEAITKTSPRKKNRRRSECELRTEDEERKKLKISKNSSSSQKTPVKSSRPAISKPSPNVLQPVSPVSKRPAVTPTPNTSTSTPKVVVPALPALLSGTEGPSPTQQRPRPPAAVGRPLKENREIKKRKIENPDLLGSIMSQMKKNKFD